MCILHALSQTRISTIPQLGATMSIDDALRQAYAADRAGKRWCQIFSDNQVVEAVVKVHMAVFHDKVEWFLGKDLVASLAALRQHRPTRDRPDVCAASLTLTKPLHAKVHIRYIDWRLTPMPWNMIFSRWCTERGQKREAETCHRKAAISTIPQTFSSLRSALRLLMPAAVFDLAYVCTIF